MCWADCRGTNAGTFLKPQLQVFAAGMKLTTTHRTVVMYMEIGGFVSCLFGWILVCSTVPTPFWSYSENSGNVMTSGDSFSNLWEDCVSDTTGATACKGYPSLMALSGRILFNNTSN